MQSIVLDPKLEAAAQARKERASKASNSRKSFGNQFTTGKRTSMDESTKDKVRAELAASRLYSCATGKVTMTAVQVAAAKVIVDKGKPSLSAVEQTWSEPAIGRSEPELLADLKRLLDAHPGLLDQIIAERAQANPGISVAPQPTGNAPQQMDKEAA